MSAVTLMLDTHLMIWLASDRHQLTDGERRAIEDHGDRLIVSAIALWELRLKWRSNPSQSIADNLIRADEALGFLDHEKIEVAPFTAEDTVAVLAPPLPHKDPFDEVMLVHAQQLGAKLLTRDGKLLRHPLAYAL